MKTRHAAAPLLLAAAAALASGCASTSSEEEELATGQYLENAARYYEDGNYDGALSQFRRALRKDPRNSKGILGEAFSLMQLGQAAKPSAEAYIWEAEAKMAALSPRDYGAAGWKVHLGRGMVQRRLADLYGQLARLRRSQAGKSGSEEAAKQAAEAEAERDRREASAVESFREVLSYEDQPLAEDNLAALFFLASHEALHAKGPADYERALGYFRRYATWVEKSKKLWVDLEKRDPESADYYRSMRERAIRQEVALRDLVADVHFKRRDHQASIDELKKVIELDTDHAPAWFNLGRNLEELGRHGAAFDAYKKFLSLTDLPSASAEVQEAAQRMAACEEKVRGSGGGSARDPR